MNDQILAALKLGEKALQVLCAEFTRVEIDGVMVDPLTLAGEIERARQAYERPDLPETSLIPQVIGDLKRRRAIHPIGGGGLATVLLFDYERKQIVHAVELLAAALKPFSSIKAPQRYAADLDVRIEVTGGREIAEAWVLEYDRCAAAGCPPPWKRPDIARGLYFPVESLSIDGITIGDIRYAQGVMLAVEPPK